MAADGLAQRGDRYVVTAGERTFEAETVVIATGVMQQPRIPSFAGERTGRVCIDVADADHDGEPVLERFAYNKRDNFSEDCTRTQAT